MEPVGHVVERVLNTLNAAVADPHVAPRVVAAVRTWLGARSSSSSTSAAAPHHHTHTSGSLTSSRLASPERRADGASSTPHQPPLRAADSSHSLLRSNTNTTGGGTSKKMSAQGTSSNSQFDGHSLRQAAHTSHSAAGDAAAVAAAATASTKATTQTWLKLFAGQATAAMRTLSSLSSVVRIRIECLATLCDLAEQASEELGNATMGPSHAFVRTALGLLPVVAYQLKAESLATSKPALRVLTSLVHTLGSFIAPGAGPLARSLLDAWCAPAHLTIRPAIEAVVEGLAAALTDHVPLLVALTEFYEQPRRPRELRDAAARQTMHLLSATVLSHPSIVRVHAVLHRSQVSEEVLTVPLGAPIGAARAAVAAAFDVDEEAVALVPAGTRGAAAASAVDVAELAGGLFSLTAHPFAARDSAYPTRPPSPLAQDVTSQRGGTALRLMPPQNAAGTGDAVAVLVVPQPATSRSRSPPNDGPALATARPKPSPLTDVDDVPPPPPPQRRSSTIPPTTDDALHRDAAGPSPPKLAATMARGGSGSDEAPTNNEQNDEAANASSPVIHHRRSDEAEAQSPEAALPPTIPSRATTASAARQGTQSSDAAATVGGAACFLDPASSMLVPTMQPAAAVEHDVRLAFSVTTVWRMFMSTLTAEEQQAMLPCLYILFPAEITELFNAPCVPVHPVDSHGVASKDRVLPEPLDDSQRRRLLRSMASCAGPFVVFTALAHDKLAPLLGPTPCLAGQPLHMEAIRRATPSASARSRAASIHHQGGRAASAAGSSLMLSMRLGSESVVGVGDPIATAQSSLATSLRVPAVTHFHARSNSLGGDRPPLAPTPGGGTGQTQRSPSPTDDSAAPLPDQQHHRSTNPTRRGHDARVLDIVRRRTRTSVVGDMSKLTATHTNPDWDEQPVSPAHATPPGGGPLSAAGPGTIRSRHPSVLSVSLDGGDISRIHHSVPPTPLERP